MCYETYNTYVHPFHGGSVQTKDLSKKLAESSLKCKIKRFQPKTLNEITQIIAKTIMCVAN